MADRTAGGHGRALALDVVTPAPAEHEALIDGALQLMRSHLGLDVAFVARLTRTDRIVRNVDVHQIDVRDGQQPSLAVGDAAPRQSSLCHYVVTGELPAFLPDAARHPVAAALPVTRELPVGTHVSVPLVLRDGTVYGTFCGFSHRVLPHVAERDLALVRRLATLVAGQLEEVEFTRRRDDDGRDRLRGLIPGRDLLVARQPIVSLADGVEVGAEGLARFPTLGRPPNEVFADAWRLGLGAELELAAAARVVELASPWADGRYVSVNVSPATMADPRLQELAATVPPGALVLELTEHTQVVDYPELVAAVRRLRGAGARLAIDDVGTGFSGLEQILRLEPQVLKIDGVLVRDIDRRPTARAMVAALVGFSAEADATLVAEQIETDAEVAALRELGVACGQGYLLARPELEPPT